MAEDNVLELLPKWIQKAIIRLGYVQDRLIFIPNPEGLRPIKSPDEYGLTAISEQITTEDDIELCVWNKEASDKAKPVLVMFHGNTGSWGDVGELAPNHPEKNVDREYRINLLREVEQTGVGYVAVHLRGYGASPDGTPSEAGFVKDVKAVIDYMDGKGIASDQLILVGESLGSAMATDMAQKMTKSEKPPSLLSTIGSFSSMAVKGAELLTKLTPEEVSPILKHKFDVIGTLSELSREDTVLNFIHADNDLTTDKSHSQALAEKGRELGFDVIHEEIAGGHKTWDPAEAFRIIIGTYIKHRIAQAETAQGRGGR